MINPHRSLQISLDTRAIPLDVFALFDVLGPSKHAFCLRALTFDIGLVNEQV